MLLGIQFNGRFCLRFRDLPSIQKCPKGMLKHEILGSGGNLTEEVHFSDG